jgi:citrate lyase subunit beta/citryl-CoA lyase
MNSTNRHTTRPWRSWLYVPGDRPDRIEKAIAGEADCVIIDLEDAVAPTHKDQARTNVLNTISTPQAKPVLVRINASGTTWQEADLSALTGAAHLAGVRIPKAETATQIEAIARQLPNTALHLLIESAKGLQASDELASAHPNVASIALGEADLRADMNITEESQLTYARGRIIASAAAAKLPAPPQSVFTNLEDEGTLRATSITARQAGFFGRTVIHPRQVTIVNEVFLPTTAEVDQARALIKALNESTAAPGANASAALVLPDGRFVDPAVAAGAQRILNIADAYGTQAHSTRAEGVS